MAREISNGTKAYADNILAGVQVTLEDALKVIENNRKEVKQCDLTNINSKVYIG